MQATLVIQCNLFSSLEEAYARTFAMDTQANAKARTSTISRN